MNKGEKTVLDLVLEELKGHREEVKGHGEVLSRLDERTLHIQARIDGVEKRTDKRSTAVSAIVATVIGGIVTFAFQALGWPRA